MSLPTMGNLARSRLPGRWKVRLRVVRAFPRSCWALDRSAMVETEPVNSQRSSITYVIKRERNDGQQELPRPRLCKVRLQGYSEAHLQVREGTLSPDCRANF